MKEKGREGKKEKEGKEGKRREGKERKGGTKGYITITDSNPNC